MTTTSTEPAVAALTVVHPTGTTSVHRFVEAPDQDADPYHQALQTLELLRREHLVVSHTLMINERALDLATVTMMHSAGFTGYTLLDAEETRMVIDELEAGR